MAIDPRLRETLKYKAVYYYYKREMTQMEIASVLNISRVTLRRLLEEAKDEGLVRVELILPPNELLYLKTEEEIQKKFKLKTVIIVDNSEHDSLNLLINDIAESGARLVESIIKSNMEIRLGWGVTLERMVDLLIPNPNINNIELVPLMGGAAAIDAIVQPGNIARTFLRKFNGVGYIINAPYRCQTESLAKALKGEPEIKKSLEKNRLSDLTIIGIGQEPDLSEGFKSYYGYDEDTVISLKKLDAVGDICAYFINSKGEVIDTPVNRKLISTHPKYLKTHKRVVVMAGGDNKHRAILAALRGGYATDLITDVTTGEFLLSHR